MIAEQKPKSVRVEPRLVNRLNTWYSKQLTKVEAGKLIQVNYRVIDRVLLTGTCSPDTKTKIETFFNN